AVPSLANRFGAARGRARDDGDARGERLEMDVAERLVAARQGDDVGGPVPALRVLPRPQPRDPLRDAEPPGELLKRARVSLADHDEAGRPIGQDAEGLDPRRDPLSRKP